jgi:hypothetical protein
VYITSPPRPSIDLTPPHDGTPRTRSTSYKSGNEKVVPEGGAMQITLDIHQHQPLTGMASSAGQAPLAFAGWLELLRVVAELAAVSAGQHPPSDAGPTTPMHRERAPA